MTRSANMNHTRALFVLHDGSPMCFYIPPGPLKRQLHPLITHGGGELCRFQQPGALLLSQPDSTLGSQYISTAYVLDCVKNKKLLDIDRYRLGRAQRTAMEEGAANLSTRQGGEKESGDTGGNGHDNELGDLVNKKTSGKSRKLGRNPYTKEEDLAILQYVRVNAPGKGTVTGNALWKEMEKKRVVRRTWQAMKDRYHRHLKGRGDYKLPPVTVSKTSSDYGQEENREPVTKKPRPSPLGKNNLSPVKMCEEKPASNECPAVEITVQMDTSGCSECEEDLEKRDLGDTQSGDKEKLCATHMEAAALNETDEDELHIFEIANMEFEIEDSPKPEVTRKSFGLKEFVMDEDTPSSESQTQADDVSSSPEVSEGEGLREALLSLMSEFKLSLCDVTQALLKNNGEMASTRIFLRTGSRTDGYPIWIKKDDLDLQNEDADTRQRLIQKYGADNVAKRVAFLAS